MGKRAKSQGTIHRPGRTAQPARLQPGSWSASSCQGFLGDTVSCPSTLPVHTARRAHFDKIAGGQSRLMRGTVSARSYHGRTRTLKVQTLEVVS